MLLGEHDSLPPRRPVRIMKYFDGGRMLYSLEYKNGVVSASVPP